MGTCSDIVGHANGEFWGKFCCLRRTWGTWWLIFSRHRTCRSLILDVRYSTFNHNQPLCLMFRAELEIDPAHRVLRQYETNIIWISQELFGPLGARDMI